MAEAHEGNKQCNVLLDGDGEPVKEADDDDIDHSNSHDCASDDKDTVAEAPAENGASQQVANVAAPQIGVSPLVVYFDSSSAEVSTDFETEVKAFAEKLQTSNPKTIEVVGYTDTSGSAAINEKLSNERASNVVASLVDAGISDGLISQKAAGEDRLATETPDNTREANNRRVVVTPIY
ncbi:MAG: OmpA family protein [Geminicoccaceae bacterium]